MKRVEAIIRLEKFDDVKEALKELEITLLHFEDGVLSFYLFLEILRILALDLSACGNAAPSGALI